jgi:hypothetical protein
MKSIVKVPAIWKMLSMPDSGKLILASEYLSGDSLSLYDINLNVFRLDKSGKIIWQVQRDDGNHPSDRWEVMHAQARERGEDGAREPFMEFMLEYPDGSNNKNELEILPDIAQWVPGSVIWLRGSAYQKYILEPESGIAKNVPEGRPRPW